MPVAPRRLIHPVDLLALVLAVGLLGWSIANRAPFDMTVAQVREPIYVQLSDGRIQNNYEIKVNNKTDRPLVLRFAVDGRIVYHRDYWDASGALASMVPIVGSVLEAVRRRL